MIGKTDLSVKVSEVLLVRVKSDWRGRDWKVFDRFVRSVLFFEMVFSLVRFVVDLDSAVHNFILLSQGHNSVFDSLGLHCGDMHSQG